MAKLDKIKLDIVKWITSLEDPETINMMNSIRLSHMEQTKDWWDELSERDKEGIKRGMEDFENGRYVSSEEFWKRIGKTLPE